MNGKSLSDKGVEVTENNNNKTVRATTITSQSLLHLRTGLKRAQLDAARPR